MKVGDVIKYSPFGGGVREVVVTEVSADVKNGEPGFDGYLVGDPTHEVWGYASQVIRTARVAWNPDCASCQREGRGAFMPPHDASRRCKSGAHAHCSCDTCF